MEIFFREKAFHAGKKSGNMTLSPSEKFSCYAPAVAMILQINFTQLMRLEYFQIWSTNQFQPGKKTSLSMGKYYNERHGGYSVWIITLSGWTVTNADFSPP